MSSETSTTDSVSDEWLWVDPSPNDSNLKERLKMGAVLVAEDISYLVETYNLLINRIDFREGSRVGAKLKGASYTMTPHPNDAWTFRKDENGNSCVVPLQKGHDPEGDYYLVPKNSLVFIRLRQELRIPYYMIGRHNLKIRYVYKGLLLGTGPQVDPGYVGRLFIPLHNFTTTDVKIHIESSFVSIDFVRTTPLFCTGETPPTTIGEFYGRFGESKKLLDPSKVNERTTLTKYLEGSCPRSQLDDIQEQFREFRKATETANQKVVSDVTDANAKVKQQIEEGSSKQSTFEKELTTKWETARNYASFGGVGILAIVVILLNLFRVDENHLEKRFRDIQDQVAFTNRIDFENALRTMALSNSVYFNDVTQKVASIVVQGALTETRLRNLESNWTQLTDQLRPMGITNPAARP